MATVSAPLMSMDASGTIAGAIVFSKWKGRPYVRRHAIPANPQTGLQVSMRAMMRFLSQVWGTLIPSPTSWEIPAKAKQISPFNEFIAANMISWRQFKTPTQETPPAKLSTLASAPTTTATGGVHSIQLSIASGANAPDFGWIIHRSLTTGFTPSLDNVLAVIPLGAPPDVFIDHPLAPATYYYRIRGFMSDGISGMLEAQVSAAAT